MSTVSLQCRSCRKTFRRPGDLESHLRQARACAWVRDLRNELPPTNMEFRQPQPIPTFTSYDFEIPLGNDIFRSYDDNLSQPEDGPEPQDPPSLTSTLYNSDQRSVIEESLDTEESVYRETIKGAGQVKGTNTGVHAAYTKTQSDSATKNIYAPFKDSVDYGVATWATQEAPGQNAFTRLLEVPGVSCCSCFH